MELANEKRYEELQSIALDYARHGEAEQLREMLAHGLPANLSDAKGNSLIMLAAYHDQAATVNMLLEQGADPERRNDRGQTPLGGVAFKGYTAIAKLLLAAGADPLASQGPGPDGQEMTPLSFAKLFGRTEIEKLLEKKINHEKAQNSTKEEN